MRQIKQVTLLLVLLVQVFVLGVGSGPFETGTGPKGEAKVQPEWVSTNGGPVLRVLPANDLTEDVVAVQEADGLSVSMEEGADPVCPVLLLADDLTANPQLDDFLKRTPGGVKAWVKLIHSSIPQPIRNKVNYLIAVNKQLKNYPNILFRFERVLPNIPSSKLNNFFSKLDNPKSVDHVRSFAGDFVNIRGISMSINVPNGLPITSIPAPQSWIDPLLILDLPTVEAVKFTNATAKTLSPGQMIYRVLDQTQIPAGGYWTYSLPSNRAQLYGGTAVRPEWNAATHYVEYTVPSSGLKIWDGPAARQAILDNVNQTHLPGGTTQIYIPAILRQDPSFSNLSLIPINL